MAKSKKKNIKEIEIEEVEEIEEFDDEEFEFTEEEEEVETNESDFTPEDLEPITLEERVIGIEKKQNIILIFVVITALLSLLVFITNLAGGSTGTFDDQTSEETQETQSATYDTSAFTEITAQELKDKSKNKSIIVWIGRQGCGYCSNFVPTITSAGEKFGQTIYYLDLAKVLDFSGSQVTVLDEEAFDILMNFKTDKDNEDVMENFGATPMTLIIKNNKIVGNIIGALPEEDVTDTLKDEGFKLKK